MIFLSRLNQLELSRNILGFSVFSHLEKVSRNSAKSEAMTTKTFWSYMKLLLNKNTFQTIKECFCTTKYLSKRAVVCLLLSNYNRRSNSSFFCLIGCLFDLKKKSVQKHPLETKFLEAENAFSSSEILFSQSCQMTDGKVFEIYVA